MQIERTKNASINMAYGVVLQIYKLLVPFVMRTIMLYVLGVQYLGLNSLFTSVLSVLNLAELGVGSAMVYSMYKPIVEDDGKKICELMQLYKIYYRVIGLVIAIVGVALTPFIPKLINGEVPEGIDLSVLYLLNLAATVLTYWLFAYKNSVIQAHQRTDVISKITLITETVKYVLQIMVLVIFQDYYLFVIVILLAQVLTNVFTAIVAKKMYPDYQAKGKLDKLERKTINQRIRDLFTSKIGAVIVNSADTIVISSFLGLTVLAIYQNYYYLFSAVVALIAIIYNSVGAGLGNSIIVDTKEKVFLDFKKFLLIIAWIAGFCTTCFLCLYQPFMELWVGADLLMEFSVVVCLVIYFFIYCINLLLNSYKDAAGMWHEDRFRPLLTAIVNFVLNIVLVQFIGLYGIILSTVLSMLFVGMPWLIHNLFTVIFERKYMKEFLVRICYYVLISTIVVGVTYVLCRIIRLPLIPTIVVRLIICCVVTNIFLFVGYRRLPEFKQCMELMDRMTRGKFGFIFKRFKS